MEVFLISSKVSHDPLKTIGGMCKFVAEKKVLLMTEADVKQELWVADSNKMATDIMRFV